MYRVPSGTKVLVRKIGQTGPWTERYTKFDNAFDDVVREEGKYAVFAKDGWEMIVFWSAVVVEGHEDLDAEYRAIVG